MVFVMIVAFSHNIYAQELHQETLYEMAHHASSNEISSIPVGNSPIAIGINGETNTIYVVNNNEGTVSVIDGSTNKNTNKDIPVGNGSLPTAIGVHNGTNTIYVAKGDGTVSVINGSTNKNTNKDIPVGKGPSAIGVNEQTNTIYVANSIEGTVSVINGSTNKNTNKDIPVGNFPSAIGINEDTNTTYVVNQGDSTVSVIDDKSNKVVARVMFNVEPFNSGHIECEKDKLIAPLSRQFYLYSGAECTAKPNQGFEFVGWQENLKGNSTQLLQVAPAPSIYDSILDLFHMKPDKPEATLNITKFGSFTANFKALPPPVPAEYIATLFTVVATAFVGTWLTPTVISWRKTRNQGKKLDYYFYEINSLQDDSKLDEKDIYKLDGLRKTITNEYTKGKINKEQFDKLINEISIRYREIFNNEIDSLDNLSEHDKENRMVEIKRVIEDAYADGKINELHYDLLQKKLSKYD